MYEIKYKMTSHSVRGKTTKKPTSKNIQFVIHLIKNNKLCQHNTTNIVSEY
jgi:hypothetical protein